MQHKANQGRNRAYLDTEIDTNGKQKPILNAGIRDDTNRDFNVNY